MKKLNQNSLLSFSFIFVLILTFTAGRSATAQDGSALEIDEFISSVEIELGGELIQLSGPLTLHVHFESQREGDANDDDKDGLDEVSAEIVAMELKGSSPTLGEVILRVNPNVPSLGQITEQANNTPGMLDLPPFSPGTADSFFDVFFEIELPSAGQSYTTLDPMRLRGVVTHKPAAPCDSFESQDEIEIFDADGNATGYFLRVRRLEGLCDDECDWNPDDGHKMHWPQLPDLGTSGIDVDMSQFFFADDFMCRATGSIDDIHFWGSFRDDVLPPNGPDSMIFEITIYSDIPATENSWSMPGDLLWSRKFSPGEYSIRKLDDSPEGWYDPAKELYLPDNHMQAYQYNFCIKEGAFIQQEGTIYWLSVKELRADDADYRFGWKTTIHELRWNDAAVFFFDDKLVSFPMKYPKGHEYMGESLDLAFVITGDEEGPEGPGEHDLGDAPDSSNSSPGQSMLAYPSGVIGNYPTVYVIGSPPYGPIHWLPHAWVYLGEIVTNETEADIGYDEDIKNNLVPADDLSDLDGGDDGVRLTLVLPDCQQATFEYMVTFVNPLLNDTPAYVNVWFDWNRDGDWDDTMKCPDGTTVPEWAVQNSTIINNFVGSAVLTTPAFMCWHSPTDAELDPIWMRITISLQPWQSAADGVMHGGAGPAGGYDYGETEDYLIYPRREGEPLKYDWGDAPTGTVAAGYPTLSFNDGANHAIAGPWLGDENDRPDSEPDGQPDTNALGDDNAVNDDENGITIPTLIPGQPANLTVEVNGGGGIVQGWIDFNQDMTWDASEKIYDGFLPTGIYTISISVPISTLAGQTFARFRISKQGGLSPKGPAPDGEVEDHEVYVESSPQFTTRPVSATQCPIAQTQCPTSVTVCPAAATICPAVATQCPAAATTCPPVKTQCPTAATICPPVQTQCPTVETECPPILTRCPPLETKCSLTPTICQGVETQCPVIETVCPPVLTKCPPTQTKCQMVETTCPPAETRCPAVLSACPPVPTQCTAVETVCPPAETLCPAVETECPSILTRCPPLETKCSLTPTICQGVETQCPAIETVCPPVSTKCPTTQTRCPAVATECPPTSTRCPPVSTECPSALTKCPPTETECGLIETRCPIVETRCPPVVSKCPPAPTQCTAEPTVCPPVSTRCPVVSTECPSTSTRCPPVSTECPTTQTRCPPVSTECPSTSTRCPPVSTECPTTQTRCPPVSTECPTTQTRCPPVSTECPSTSTRCPPVSTECPTTQTRCPPVSTECPTTQTRCPSVSTECPSTSTRCPPSQTQCPTVDTQCPPTKTRCPVEKTKCPESSTNCPSVATQCPAVDTQCPPVETRCPLSETKCPAVVTKCIIKQTECPDEPTWCPAVETECPSLRTRCPAVSTQCPAVMTSCPAVQTECPSEPTRCPPVETKCPAVASICYICPVTFLPDCGPITSTPDCFITIGPTCGPLTSSSPFVRECPTIDVQAPTVVSRRLLAKAP